MAIDEDAVRVAQAAANLVNDLLTDRIEQAEDEDLVEAPEALREANDALQEQFHQRFGVRAVTKTYED